MPVIDKPKYLVATLLVMSYVMTTLVNEVTIILFMMAIFTRVTMYCGTNPHPSYYSQ